MMHRRYPLTAALAALALSAAPALAQDGECASDADCGAGFVCASFDAGGCTDAPCAADGECPEPVCEEFTYTECVPAPCESDTDCGAEQVCLKEVYEETAGDCPPNADCVPSEPTTVEYAECVARWDAPCGTAADCGPGFSCEQAQSCWCNGSAGVACPDNQPCPEPEPVDPECGCDATGEFYCVLDVVECSADTDCGDGLVCDENPNRGVCQGTSTGGSAGDSAGGADSADGAGGAGAPAPVDNGCPPSDEPAKVCMPKGYYDSYGGGGRYAQSEAGGDVSLGTSGDADDDAASPAAPGGGGNATVCSVGNAGAGTGGGVALWMMAAAALLLRRRRS